MQYAKNTIRISALALGIVGALVAGNASAEGFHLKENSIKAQGRSNAGSASTKDDASVVVNNPAMMSTFTETTVQTDMSVIDLSFEFEGGGYDGLGNALTGNDGGDAGGLNAVPAASFVKPLEGGFEGLTVGMMLSAPFGLKTEYDNGWVGRYHALESDVKVVDLTFSASVNLGDKVSVGAGVFVERAEVTLSNAIDFGTGICNLAAFLCAPGSVYGPQMNDGSVSIEGNDTNIGWIAGVSFRPTENLSIGYSHRSEVDHEISGEADFYVPADPTGANVRGLLDLVGRSQQYLDGGGGAKLTLPSIDIFSVTWQVNDKLALMAEHQRTDWQSLQEVRITFDNPAQEDSAEDYKWKHANFYSLGGDYKLNDRLTLRAGVGRDEAPVSRPHRTPRLPDQDRYFYSLGFTWDWNEHLSLSGSFTNIQIIDTPEVEIVSEGSGQGALLSGTFDGGANIYGFSAQYRF